MTDSARAITTIHDAPMVDYGAMFSDARLELIRNTVAQGAPDDVFLAMIDIARTRRLDPLAKQIICVKFGGRWQYIVTIDGYRSIAEQTGQYAGSDAPVFTWPDETAKTPAGKHSPDSATVTVWKLVKGDRYPFAATVYWEEYSTGQNNWSTMPRTMLAKVAESHALRKAFPAVLSGMYTDAEMDQDSAVEASGRIVDRTTGEVHEPTPVRNAPQERQEAQQRAQRPRQAKPDADPRVGIVNRLASLVSTEALAGWADREHNVNDPAKVPVAELSGLYNSLAKDLEGIEAFEHTYAVVPAQGQLVDAPGAVDVTRLGE